MPRSPGCCAPYEQDGHLRCSLDTYNQRPRLTLQEVQPVAELSYGRRTEEHVEVRRTHPPGRIATSLVYLVVILRRTHKPGVDVFRRTALFEDRHPVSQAIRIRLAVEKG